LSLVATFLKNGKERKSNTEQKTVACEVEAWGGKFESVFIV
jgi:hypothetical protein